MSDADARPTRTAGDDPGLVRSLTSGEPVGQIRLTGLVFSLLPVLVVAVLPVVIPDDADPRGLPVALGIVLAAAAGGLVGQALLVPRQFRPVDKDTPAEQAAREGGLQVRSAMFLRLSLAELPILVGFVATGVAESVWPYAVGFVVGWPLMLLSLPTAGQIERARARMESAGAQVPIWNELLRG